MKYRLVCSLGCVLTLAAAAAHAQNSAMRLLTASSGWVSTENHLLWTSTSGREWTEITPAETRAIRGAFFLDTAHGWALVTAGKGALEIARTVDGGKSWAAASFPLSASDLARVGGSASLSFVDGDHGWAMLRQAANSNFSRGILFSTADGGRSWTKLPAPPLGDPARFVTTADGWVAGGPTGNQLYLTRDGGHTWSPQPMAMPAGVDAQSAVRYHLPVFSSAQDGLLAARYTWSGNAVLVLRETQDGGAHWNTRMVLAGADSEHHPAISIVDSHVMRVTTDRIGTLATTVDEASAVSDGLISPDANILAADFASTSHGWILTSEGHCIGYKTGCSQQERLFATSDAGKSFHEITPSAMQPVAVADSGMLPGSTVVGTGEGFDACDPTTSGLATWFKDSPYHYVNVYIGGNNAACPQNGLSSSWVSTVVGQGWGLIPTWVGPQAPHPCTSCSGCSSFSSNTTTAASQAVTQAQNAANKMASIGLSGTIVYYDLEEYTDSSSCSAAAKAFVNSWVQELHKLGYSAGVYGSPSDANNDWYNISNRPDDIWIALWNDVASVENLTPIPNSDWANNQRIHQYWCCPTQTYGGVSYNIDQDYLAGAVAK